MIGLLVPADVDAGVVRDHLDDLGALFDAAAEIPRPDVPFATDLSAEGRAVAVDGSRELVEAGLHREAVFWIVLSAARCLTVVGGSTGRVDPTGGPLRQLTADLLGVVGTRDLTERRSRCLDELAPPRQVCAELVEEAQGSAPRG